jgi:hypothetical protein|tara:strand:- start:425 stop:712 length:288 start_codon:yes stop_codon:yes gene_type:complete
MSKEVKDINKVELSDKEIEQINIRMGVIDKRSQKLNATSLELSILRSELSKHIENMVVLKGKDSGLSWIFDGEKLIQKCESKDTSNIEYNQIANI